MRFLQHYLLFYPIKGYLLFGQYKEPIIHGRPLALRSLVYVLKAFYTFKLAK
jgi:hypothetical protein